MAAGKPNQNFGVEMYGFPDFVHVPSKKAHYDAWSNSTGSSSGCSSSCSPSHLEELHVDIPHSSTASVASTSTASHSFSETDVNAVRAPVPTFVDLKPISPKDGAPSIAGALALASEVLANSGPSNEIPSLSTSFSEASQSAYQSATTTAPDAVVAPLAPKPIYPNVQANVESGSHPVITHDARFSSYAEFDEAFEAWKRECLHPFRVASSETLREPDGTVNHRFKYRYVVFHCAHYGEPRMRGIGKRPNQHYLPSGCRAMLRLNYSFSEQLLKITTLHDEHLNHEVSPEMFRKVSAKLKRSSCGAPSPAGKRSKLDSPVPSSQSVSSPVTAQSSPMTGSNSPSSASTVGSMMNAFPAQISLAQPNAMANVAIALQQQQIMASLLNQQKENINLAAGLSSLGIPRPQPSMLNILSMMGLQQRMLLQQQPAYGLMTPLAPQMATLQQAQIPSKTDGKSNASDVERQNRTKTDLPAPVALKPSTASSSSASQVEVSPGSPPPHLVAEAPVPASQVPANASTSPAPTTIASAGSFEESLALLRNGGHDSEIMTRIAQLNSLSSFWGTPTISEFR
ncbi:hypothetical protein RB195_011310 [Necator americanus]